MVGGVAGGAFVLSRAYQQRTAAELFGRYESAPRAPLPTTERSAGGGRTLIAVPDWRQSLPGVSRAIESRFISVRFRDDLCGPGSLPLTIRYDGRRRDADLSEPITVRLHPPGSAPTTLFVVTYDWADDYFPTQGIEVAADQLHCVGDLSRVDGVERTPLLLTTSLGADWRQERLYQRLQ